MKKVIVIILLLTISAIGYAQCKAVIDKVNQDGSRIIATEKAWFRTGFTDRNPLGFSLMAIASDSIEIYSLCISINSLSSFTIPEGAIVLIKTGNEEVIELKQRLDTRYTEDILGNYIPVANTRVHTMAGVYDILPQQIDLLKKSGIIKIRIETDLENLDSQYKTGKAEEIKYAFSNMADIITKRLSVKKSIRDGF